MAGSRKPFTEVVIGLEVHVQLQTKSKIFSGASTAYGAEPNTQACAIDLGMPGVLPVLNEEAVRMAIKFGLSVDAEIAPRCVFARKHYFYPDLPKGYQISQYELPIVAKGHLDIEVDGQTKRIGITRAHLEEDAGKSMHEGFGSGSGIDLNRAGTPLIEIVSEPDIRSAAEAVAYLKKLHSLVRYLEICDGNMQEGSFRCDANVSVRRQGATEFGTRTETQETRLFNTQTGETRAMRSKEEANDYRYFPDPDLLPVVTTESDIIAARTTMPELPDAKRDRFVEQYGLSAYDAGVLTSTRELADYYEQAVEYAGTVNAKLTANWVMGDLAASLNADGLDIGESRVDAKALAGLVMRIADNTISGKIAKDVFIAMWAGEGTADEIIESKGLKQITDPDALGKILDEVIAANPTQLEQYRSGKDKLFGYFVGQAMKATKGKANPAEVNRLLKEKLQG